nr:RagB/SusD family nutrient uptake outer membrane protein [uncultured Pedobacter sp.]
MKKIIYIAVLAGTVFFTACKKELNQTPISAATTETFYAIPNDFIQGVNAVYASLRTYPDRILNLSETRSDNLYAVSDGGVRDWEGINGFQKNLSSNPYIEEAWGTDYNGIYKANIVLDQIEKNGAVINDATLRNRLAAEAKFLRAFYYFDLVRTYGKVPLIDKVVTAEQALTISRSAVADVYNLIQSDLQFAIDNLPPTYAAAADKGRATSYAAKGILALVYMTKSGPTYGIDGPGLASNEWSKAYTLLNNIVTDNKYSLVTSSYANIFSYTNENNSEVIFDVEYNTGSSPITGATFPWLLAPDAWFTSSLGKPVQGGLTIRPISNSLLNSYATGDVRKTFSIQNGYTGSGNVVETQSFFKKYIDVTKVPTNRLDWPINFIVLRYTDVLMLRAECVLNGGGGNLGTDVIIPINQIRARAGLTIPLVTLTLAQLMEERRREFAGEGLRWNDLVRSGLVTSVIPAWIAADDVQHKIAPFTNDFIIYPVPFNQINLKPGLYTQNPGYN